MLFLVFVWEGCIYGFWWHLVLVPTEFECTKWCIVLFGAYITVNWTRQNSVPAKGFKWSQPGHSYENCLSLPLVIGTKRMLIVIHQLKTKTEIQRKGKRVVRLHSWTFGYILGLVIIAQWANYLSVETQVLFLMIYICLYHLFIEHFVALWS